VVKHFRPLDVFRSRIAPFDFFAPMPIKIAPLGAISPTLRNNGLAVRLDQFTRA